nr:hypothetical protein [Tanacetum cinerariifolium]
PCLGEEDMSSDVGRSLYYTARYWVAEGPPRQQVRATDRFAEIDPEVPQDAPVCQEDVQPNSAPQEALQMPQAAVVAPRIIHKYIGQSPEKPCLGEEDMSSDVGRSLYYTARYWVAEGPPRQQVRATDRFAEIDPEVPQDAPAEKELDMKRLSFLEDLPVIFNIDDD